MRELNADLSEHDELAARLRALRARGGPETLAALSLLVDDAYEIDARFVIRRAIRTMARLGGTEALIGVVRGYTEHSWVRACALAALDSLGTEARKRVRALEARDMAAYYRLQARRELAAQRAA